MSGNREPGDGLNTRDIYEVWGDVVENAADKGSVVIVAIHTYLKASYQAEFLNCRRKRARHDGCPFLTLRWGELVTEVDARPFGDHLDVYAILIIRKKLLDNPDPAQYASLSWRYGSDVTCNCSRRFSNRRWRRPWTKGDCEKYKSAMRSLADAQSKRGEKVLTRIRAPLTMN